MSYDAEAFLRHQVERGMSFAGLCRAYGASARMMSETLRRAGLLLPVVPAEPGSADGLGEAEEPIPEELAAILEPLPQALYRELRRCAARGERCPTNEELARTLASNRTSLQRAMRRLEEAGAVRWRTVWPRGGSRCRVVEILETGQATAEPAGEVRQ